MSEHDPSLVSGSGLIPAAEPDYAVPPGETLRDRLDELGMHQSELATRTGLTPKHVNQVLRGLVPLSADVAQRLEYATGVPARLWNRLEADYRSAQVRLEQRRLLNDPVRDWLRQMPVRELVAAGAIPASPADQASRARQLLAFFGVASPQAWQKLWARPTAAFRQSQAYSINDAAAAAWLRLGEIAARDVASAPFDAASLRALLPELRSLTLRPLHEGVTVARAKLASVGVILVLVPEIRGARAYGATRWLTPTTALVQLSLRGKTDDALWTTLFHELGHVLLHNKRDVFIEFDDEPTGTVHSSNGPAGTKPNEALAEAAPKSRRGEDRLSRAEAEARQFALRNLLGADIDQRLTAVKSHSDAYDLAESRGVAVSLVAARLAGVGLWTHREASALRKSVPPLEDLLGPAPAAPRPRARPAGHRRAGDGMPNGE